MNINQEVVAELTELKKLGVRVSAKVIKKAASADLSEYSNMSVSEIADLLIMLG
jgi:hypothetical protein